MGMAQKILPLFDLGYSPNPVFIKRSHIYRSYYCGVISFMLLLIFLTYSFTKLFAMQWNVNIDSSRVASQSISMEIKNLPFKLLITLNEVTTSSAGEESVISQIITPSNMYKNGLEVVCIQQGTYWQHIYNMQQQYSTYIIFPKQKQIFFHTSAYDYSRNDLQIRNCNPNLHSQCQHIQNISNKVLTLSYTGIFNRQIFNPYNNEPYKQYFNEKTTVRMNQTANFQRYIYTLHQYDIEIDRSVLPKFLSGSRYEESLWCYWDDMKTEKIAKPKEDQKIAKIELKINKPKEDLKITKQKEDLKNEGQQNHKDKRINLHENQEFNYTIFHSFRFETNTEVSRYQQINQKIDYVLPQIFTLLSLLAMAIRISSSHYRRWCIQIEAANVLFSEKGVKNPWIISPNLKNYFRYFLFKGSAKKQIQEYQSDSLTANKTIQSAMKLKYTQKKLQKVAEKLDYIGMKRQIDDLKKTVKFLSQIIKHNGMKINGREVAVSSSDEEEEQEEIRKFSDVHYTSTHREREDIKRSLMSDDR